MKAVLAIALMVTSSATVAQSSGGYSYASGGFQSSTLQSLGGFSTFDPNYNALRRSGGGVCQPSRVVQDERTARALALRTEAAALVERDGGTLSRWSEERIRRKASAILAYGC